MAAGHSPTKTAMDFSIAIPAPGAGIAMLIREGLEYNFRYMRDEEEECSNGVVQEMTIESQGRTRITGAYFSPSTSRLWTERTVREIMSDGSGQDAVIGDFNGR